MAYMIILSDDIYPIQLGNMHLVAYLEKFHSYCILVLHIYLQ